MASTNPFKGRHFPGELTLLCVRWYLRYPLAYQHVAEVVRERDCQMGADGGEGNFMSIRRPRE
jgi:transposase, IS6 family